MKRVNLFVQVLPKTRRDIKRMAKDQAASQGQVIDQAMACLPASITAMVNGVRMKKARDGIFRA